MKTCDVSGITRQQCQRLNGSCQLRRITASIDHEVMLRSTIEIAEAGCKDPELIADLQQRIICIQRLSAKER